MRKFIKSQLIELIETIESGIEYAVSKHENPNAAQNMLMDCYEGITSVQQRIANNISKGNLDEYTKNIEDIQNKLELLNDAIFNNSNFDEIHAEIKNQMTTLKGMVEQEKVKLEVVFFPYKASMWDSLESIWLAACEDENCDAYVVPIPYFDRNQDRSLGEMHYEGTKFPEYVPVVDWQSYNLEKRRPDVVYVHNPYDDYNLVTVVHSNYFSENLKNYADTLVYVPYYSTSGVIGEGQGNLPSYKNFDYIVAQAERYIKFYNPELKDKLLPFGSPKFDRVINMCKNPPEVPNEWKEKINGKKVYFFNTSISGLLQNTGVFLNKMKYVFETFQNRDDVVLLWRPHPLLETTLRSMRPQFLEYYLKLKQLFIAANIGILDTTPDVTKTIALCDAYIGDLGSSLTSLFGVAGKPMFILYNWINSAPTDDDWRGQVLHNFSSDTPEYIFTWDNKVFKRNINYEYKFLCNASEYSMKDYYIDAKQVGEKIYLCPGHAQEIGVIENGNLTKISLKNLNERMFNFSKMYAYGKYIVLIPQAYPAIVRYDTVSNKIDYFSEKLEHFIPNDGDKKVCGSCLRGNMLFLASTVGNYVLALDILTGKQQILTTGSETQQGCASIFDDGVDLWLMPLVGRTIVRWNPMTGEMNEYSDYPDNFNCTNIIMGIDEDKYAFKSAVAYGDYILFAPWWANMFIKINKKTGEVSEWIPPFEVPYLVKTGYYANYANTSIFNMSTANETYIRTYNDNSIYKINLLTNEYEKIEINIEKNFLRENEPGFSKMSNTCQYGCMENPFNSLKDFIDENMTGNKFDKQKQLELYSDVVANIDGICGQKVHEFIKGKNI